LEQLGAKFRKYQADVEGVLHQVSHRVNPQVGHETQSFSSVSHVLQRITRIAYNHVP
jgi:hypothetical protein